MGLSTAVPVHRGPRQAGTAGADPSAGSPLQQARALPQRAAYDEYRARRVVAEHRLVQLGIRQSRYCGRAKTRFQLYLAATVANLTLVLGNIGLSGSTGGGAAGHRVVLKVVRAVVANAAANCSAARLGQLWSLIWFVSALPPKSFYPIRAFRHGVLGGVVKRVCSRSSLPGVGKWPGMTPLSWHNGSPLRATA